MIDEALTGLDYQNAWCHMDNAIATCVYPPNAKNPLTNQNYPPDQWWNRISLAVFLAMGTRAFGEAGSLP